MSAIRRYVLLGMMVSIATAVGCARVETVESPLIDDRHRPIVLTEQRRLTLPGTKPGTRFVRGWRFAEGDDGLKIRPSGAKAVLEIVQLAPHERRLVMDLAGSEDGSGGVVRARAPDRDLGVFDLVDPIEIPLPADLGPGRIPIELEFSTEVELAGVAMNRAAPRGQIEFDGVDVIQSGWSAVEFVRWLDGGGRLVGELIQPSEMLTNQKFSIAVDSGDGRAMTVFDADASKPREAGRKRAFDLPLDVSGLVRIRLTAKGRGPAGRWQGLRLVSRRRQYAPVPESIPDPPKLVVVYVFDALRADHVGHLGSTVGASPCLDRLATEGAVFTNHFSVAPNTGPATASLFTGQVFFGGRGLPPSSPETLAEVFADAGFVTASISSNPHLSPSYGLARGFGHVEFLPLDQDHRVGGKVLVNDSAAQVHRAALKWLDDQNPDEPVFLYLHTLHPHNPYTPPEPFPSRFVSARGANLDGRTRTLASIRDLERDITLEEQRWLRQRYAANLAYNDAELCGLVEELTSRYPREVMLVITSDHGEELFDHGGVLHGFTLYDEMLHVPLVVWWPGLVDQKTIDEPTGTLDLHATLRDLAAPPPPRGAEDGRPLWRAILGREGADGEPALQFAIAPGLRQAVMARSEQWKLILVPWPRLDWGMGRGRGRSHEAEYLFHLESDPGEGLNRSGSQSVEADWLWSRLQVWRAEWRSRRPRDVDRREVDDATKRQLEVLGYVE
jgi:arylsulfatase A-like enzyme